MVDELEGFGLEAETAELAGFYDSVRRRVEGIDNAEGKQRVVVELYERFFKVAYPKGRRVAWHRVHAGRDSGLHRPLRAGRCCAASSTLH